MGGWIGFGMAQYEPDRVERLVIGGQHPYARVREALRQMVRTGIAGGAEAFIAAAEKMWGFTATPKVRDNLCSQDLEALLAMTEDTPGLEHVLPQMQMPCCIYSGEADPVCGEAQAASRLIPNARFFSLPGLTHAGAYQRSDLVVPKVGAFLRDTA
jgi:pimeloyl-ACP methyl ester carboxylesterase